MKPEWGDESHRNCYNAFKSLCRENSTMVPIEQMEYLVSQIGADATYQVCDFEKNLPKDVCEIARMMLRQAKYTQACNM